MPDSRGTCRTRIIRTCDGVTCWKSRGDVTAVCCAGKVLHLRARMLWSLRSAAGKRRRSAVTQRRAHSYSTERMDKPIIRRSTPGITGRNNPAAPSRSRNQPDAIRATRFIFGYWMQTDRVLIRRRFEIVIGTTLSTLPRLGMAIQVTWVTFVETPGYRPERWPGRERTGAGGPAGMSLSGVGGTASRAFTAV